MDKGHQSRGRKPVSNQENGVDEFGASLLEIHGASKLTAVAGVIQIKLSFNCDLNGAFAHVRACERDLTVLVSHVDVHVS